MRLALALVLALSSTGQSEEKDKKSFDPFSEQEEEALPEGDDATVETPAEKPPEPAPKIEPPPPAVETKPRVLVLVVPDTASGASLANRIGAEATRRLAKAKNLTPQSLEEVLAPNAKQRRAADLRTALDSARKGMRAFEELDLEAAGAELETSINTLLAYSDDLDAEARATLEAAIFCSGATTLFEGQTGLAESTFVALLLLNPQYEPDTELYPSNVVSRFLDLKAKVETRPTGGLTVNTNPSGADVYVDGTYRGGSPLEIGGLADGQHVVVVRRIGFKPFGTLAPVTVERQASIDVDLEAEDDADLAQQIEVSLSRNARASIELGKQLGVAKLAVVSLERRMSGAFVEGFWLDIEKGETIAPVKTSVLEEPESAAQSIVDAIAKAEAGPIVADVADEVDQSGPITEAWWFWAIAGTLAAAAAGAATVAIVSGVNDNDTRPPPGTVVLGF